VLTGNASRLTRGQERRDAFAGANEWLGKTTGVDFSSLASRYEAVNKALQINEMKFNLVRNAENEIHVDIENLRAVMQELGLSDLQAANQVKAWALGQITDPRAIKYVFLLNQLQNDITLYNQASQGGESQAPTDALRNEAREIIGLGASEGSLEGLFSGLTASVAGMSRVNLSALNRTEKAIWDMFGVGENYRPRSVGVETFPVVEPPGLGQTGETGGAGTQPTGDGVPFDPFALPPAETAVPGDNEVDISIQGRG